MCWQDWYVMSQGAFRRLRADYYGLFRCGSGILSFGLFYDRSTGELEGLVTIVRKYEPRVKCGEEFEGGGEPGRSPCADTLSRIPVSVFVLLFGRERVPGVSWKVPWSYRAGMCVPCHIAPCGSELPIEDWLKGAFYL